MTCRMDPIAFSFTVACTNHLCIEHGLVAAVSSQLVDTVVAVILQGARRDPAAIYRRQATRAVNIAAPCSVITMV